MLNAVDENILQRMLEQGEKIKAIRFVMQQTGVSLSEAKNYVDASHSLDMGAAKVVYPPEPRGINRAVEERVCSMLAQREKVQAIAYLREQTGMSLDEARQYTKTLWTQAEEGDKSFFTVMKQWSPAKKALLFLAVIALPFLFMYLMMLVDRL